LPIEITPTGDATSIDVTSDGMRRAPSQASFAPPVEVTIDNSPKPRTLPDSVRERLAALAAGPPAKVAPPEPKPDDGVGSSPPSESVKATPANENEAPEPEKVEPEVAAAPAEWEAERDEMRGIHQRQREIIGKLQTELETAKKAAPTGARTLDLDDLESRYYRDPSAALYHVIGALMDKEADSDDVKKEMEQAFIDLTSRVIDAPMDPAHQAKRVSDLTRREWDRTTKRREAGEKKQAEAVTPNEPGDPLKQAVEFIAAPFKSIADKFPHLMEFAQEFDRTDPQEIVADLLLKGLKSGDFSADEDTAKAVERAAKLADQHYKRRLEAIEAKAAKRKPSTASPGVPATKQDPPAAQPAKTVERQSNGRGLSNADASVAPSKTPSETPQTEQPRKFRTDAERRHWATRHLRGEK